jgi:2-dehydropantoate 2-reductase
LVARISDPVKIPASIQEERGMKKRIAVVGAGAVGGYVGSSLFHAGHDVTLIDPWPEHVEAIRANGMNLYGMTEAERKTVKVPAIHLTEVQQIAKQRPIDIALISVKSYDTIWACRMIKQYLAADGIVVSMQNCVNEERVASVAGWGRTLGIIVGGGVGVDLYEPGHIRRGYAKRPQVTSFYVGEPSGMITKRSRELAAIMNDVDTAKATDNLWGERWTKLCVNAMRNGVSAATGMGGNERDRHDAVRRVCIALGGESVRVGQRLGYRLGPIGSLPPESLARAMEGDKAATAEIETLMLGGTG